MITEKKANSLDAILFWTARSHFDGELQLPLPLKPRGSITELGCLIFLKILNLRFFGYLYVDVFLS